MPDLVTLAQAKRHLRLDPPASPVTEDEVQLQETIAQASALIVLQASQRRSDDGAWAAEVASWDVIGSPSSVPAIVQLATLQLIGDLWRGRGDDDAGTRPTWEFGLPPRVKALIDQLRDPALS